MGDSHVSVDFRNQSYFNDKTFRSGGIFSFRSHSHPSCQAPLFIVGTKLVPTPKSAFSARVPRTKYSRSIHKCMQTRGRSVRSGSLTVSGFLVRTYSFNHVTSLVHFKRIFCFVNWIIEKNNRLENFLERDSSIQPSATGIEFLQELFPQLDDFISP